MTLHTGPARDILTPGEPQLLVSFGVITGPAFSKTPPCVPGFLIISCVIVCGLRSLRLTSTGTFCPAKTVDKNKGHDWKTMATADDNFNPPKCVSNSVKNVLKKKKRTVSFKRKLPGMIQGSPSIHLLGHSFSRIGFCEWDTFLRFLEGCLLPLRECGALAGVGLLLQH